jgi:hypothetical protein
MLLNVVVVGFVAIIVLAIGVMIYVWLHRSRDALTRRALKSTRRVDIGTVADGATVKIGGRVSYEGEPLEAPLSRRRCACWEVVVEQEVSNGEITVWNEVIRTQSSQPFVLDDGTGRALVKARSPALALHQDKRTRSGGFDDASSRLAAFIAQLGPQYARYGVPSTAIRYREGAIEAGETVSAYGRVSLEPDPDGGGDGSYRKAAVRVVLVDPDEGQMLLSDDESTAR